MTNKELIGIILASTDENKINDLVKRYDKVSEWQDIIINIEDSYFEVDKLFKDLKKKGMDDVINLGVCEVVATLSITNTDSIRECAYILNKYFFNAEASESDKTSAKVSLYSSIWDRLYYCGDASEVESHVTCFDISHNKIKLDDEVYYLNFTEEPGWIVFYPKSRDKKKFKACCVFIGKDDYEIMYTPDIAKYEMDERIRLMPPRNSVIYANDNEDDDYFEDEIDTYEFNTNGTY